jgi:hypothetical protein
MVITADDLREMVEILRRVVNQSLLEKYDEREAARELLTRIDRRNQDDGAR